MVDPIKVIVNIMSHLPLLLILSCNENSSIQPEPVSEIPEVNIVSPIDSSFIGDLINIIVSATDNKGIEMVEIYIDNETNSLRTLSVEPYEYLWDASNEANNSTHTIYAKAYDGDDNISTSKVITVTKVKIEPPTNFSADLNGDSAVVFSWDISDPNELTFLLEESINGGEFREKNVTQTGVLTLTLKQPFYIDFTYIYRMRSRRNEILSNPSNLDTVKVLFPKPTDFRVNRISSTNLGLSWLDNCGFETGYLVEKSEDAGAFIQMATLPANSFYYLDNSFNENSINIYVVRAISTHNRSDSAFIIISRPPVISNSAIEPDTVVVTATVEILTSLEATDPDENGDIEGVYFSVYRPDGTVSQKIFLFDDGNPENGDAIAGDGIYSRLIEVNEYNDKGTYRFEFQAENKAGSLSNIINHFVLIL